MNKDILQKYIDFVENKNLQEYKDFKSKQLLFQKLKNGNQHKRVGYVRMVFYLAGLHNFYQNLILTVRQPHCKHFISYQVVKGDFKNCKTIFESACTKYFKDYESKLLTCNSVYDLHLPSIVRNKLKTFKSYRDYYLYENDYIHPVVLQLKYNSDLDWEKLEYDLLKYHKNNVYMNYKSHNVYCASFSNYTSNIKQ